MNCPPNVKDYLQRRARNLDGQRLRLMIELDIVELEHKALASMAKEHDIRIDEPRPDYLQAMEDIRFLISCNRDRIESRLGGPFLRTLEDRVAAIASSIPLAAAKEAPK